jgi:hypothetical protein
MSSRLEHVFNNFKNFSFLYSSFFIQVYDNIVTVNFSSIFYFVTKSHYPADKRETPSEFSVFSFAFRNSVANG